LIAVFHAHWIVVWVRLKALPTRVVGRRAFGTHSLRLQVMVSGAAD
jgi:hypothetical protein